MLASVNVAIYTTGMATQSITGKIRAEIRKRRITGYRVAKETGISEPAVNRFLNEETDLQGANLNKVAAYLGLVLVDRAELAALRKASKG